MARKPTKRCERCKWWEPMDYDPPWGSCALAESGDMAERPAESKAITNGGADGYYSKLHTRPDFGCVQWEAR